LGDGNLLALILCIQHSHFTGK